MSDIRTAKRALIIGPSNIGDAILAAEVVAAVHRYDPAAYLTLVVGERATALFQGDPRIRTLVNADHYDSLTGRLQLAWALWRYRPHLVVDLRHTLYPLLLKPLTVWRYLRQPPARLVHMRDRHWWRLTAQAPQVTKQERSTHQHADGASPAVSLILLTPKDTAHVEGLMRRWPLVPDRPLVVMCPGARSHIKRWMTAGFAAVADRLIDERGVQVVFSGELEEAPIVEEILSQMRQRAVNAVGHVTIRQLAVLMQHAQLVLTNDSASLHLASAVDVPTVAIFGPTDERQYGPTARGSRVVRRRLFCAPCERALCRFSHECMRFVTVEEVVGAAVERLQNGRRDPAAQDKGGEAGSATEGHD